MECLNPIRMVNTDRSLQIMHGHERPTKLKVANWVPCNKCVNCNINRQNEWVFRLEQEAKQEPKTYFITLTYNDEHLPVGTCDQTGHIHPTLNYEHVQLYMKRLRKKSKNKIKHYSVGEYGEKTQRPHYHQILFGADAKRVESSWTYGHSQVRPVTPARIRYVTKYMGKRISNTPEGMTKPMNVMSRGLGLSYLTPEILNHHQKHQIDYLTLDDGIKMKMPKYYLNKIFTEKERFVLTMKRKADSDLKLKRMRAILGGAGNWRWTEYCSYKSEEKFHRNAYNERKKQKQSISNIN